MIDGGATDVLVNESHDTMRNILLEDLDPRARMLTGRHKRLGFWIDRELASDGMLNALVAAEYGVPVILVTGDDQTCKDAKTYAPDARTVEVKEAVSRYAAICAPPSVTADWIRAAAADAMCRVGFTAPSMYDGMRCFRVVCVVTAAAREPIFG